MGKILSYDDVRLIKRDIEQVDGRTQGFRNCLSEVITQFKENETVQSFFVSGNFGQKQWEALENLLNAFEKYYQLISGREDSLTKKTIQFCDIQLGLIEEGK